MEREPDVPHGEVLFTEAQVEARVKEMAAEILETYEKSPLFVCLMKGGVPFAAQLMRDIAEVDPNFHPEMDYMTISTYGSEREAGRPRVVMDIDPRTEVAGRDVMILDDVFDEGHTANFAYEHFQHLGAADVKMAVLGDKQKEVEGTRPEMVGFNLPDRWLTGEGMDDANIAPEANRWLGGIAIAK